MVSDNYYVDPQSGAWIFKPDKTKKLAKENKEIKQLLQTILQALPGEVLESIPAEQLRVLNGN